MRKHAKRIILVASMGFILATTPSGCVGHENDYHQGDDNKWLIEQVEQGNITEEEANKIRQEWKNGK